MKTRFKNSGGIGLGKMGGVSTTPAFSPSSITGLVWWLKADAGVFKDAAKTIPATADGDAVYTWADQSTAGVDPIQATLSARPLLKLNVQNGLPVLRFAGANSQCLITGNVNPINNLTIYMVVKGANTTQGYALAFGSSGNAIIHDYTATKWEWYSTPRTVIGTTSTSIFQGISTSLGATQPTIPGTWRVSTDGAANFSSQDIGEVIVYNNVLSPANDTLVKNYLISRWNLPPF